jgi:hypothetical protein
VGRHLADDGVGVDPIVEAALRRRALTAEPVGPRHGDGEAARLSSGEGGLGWPGGPRDGTGLGWPVDLLTEAVPGGQAPTVSPAAGGSPARRRGWRRLFGSTAA